MTDCLITEKTMVTGPLDRKVEALVQRYGLPQVIAALARLNKIYEWRVEK